MRNCPICHRHMQVTGLTCTGCSITVQGDFYFPPLARLSRDKARLAEALILASGNLKTLARELNITYPTLRKRLDDLIETLKDLQTETGRQTDNVLDAMEQGSLNSEAGVRLIKEIQGEL